MGMFQSAALSSPYLYMDLTLWEKVLSSADSTRRPSRTALSMCTLGVRGPVVRRFGFGFGEVGVGERGGDGGACMGGEKVGELGAVWKSLSVASPSVMSPSCARIIFASFFEFNRMLPRVENLNESGDVSSSKPLVVGISMSMPWKERMREWALLERGNSGCSLESSSLSSTSASSSSMGFDLRRRKGGVRLVVLLGGEAVMAS